MRYLSGDNVSASLTQFGKTELTGTAKICSLCSFKGSFRRRFRHRKLLQQCWAPSPSELRVNQFIQFLNQFSTVFSEYNAQYIICAPLSFIILSKVVEPEIFCLTNQIYFLSCSVLQSLGNSATKIVVQVDVLSSWSLCFISNSASVNYAMTHLFGDK